MSNQEHTDGLTRRTLIKSTALGSLALAAGGLSLPFSLSHAAAAVQDAAHGEERIVWGACSVNCGSRCVHTCVTMKSSGSKPTIPARIFMAITRCAPACAADPSAAALIILTALTIP